MFESKTKHVLDYNVHAMGNVLLSVLINVQEGGISILVRREIESYTSSLFWIFAIGIPRIGKRE
jgi:hypothetical protein